MVKSFTLFNLEGTARKQMQNDECGMQSEKSNSELCIMNYAFERSERNGPIAQLARAHD